MEDLIFGLFADGERFYGLHAIADPLDARPVGAEYEFVCQPLHVGEIV